MSNELLGMGFDAIWLSPIVENTEDGYHGYHAKDFYKINPFFGTEQDFIDLVQECHRRGETYLIETETDDGVDIWVMIDVVANHVGPVGLDFGKIAVFNSSEHYHDWCDIQMSDFKHNQWRVENCRLAALPDLKQENPFVKEFLLKWIKDIIKKYDLDGIRIDTIPEVPKWFWKEFTQAAGVFSVGEAFDERYDYVGSYQSSVGSMLNYPFWYAVRDIFRYNQPMGRFHSKSEL